MLSPPPICAAGNGFRDLRTFDGRRVPHDATPNKTWYLSLAPNLSGMFDILQIVTLTVTLLAMSRVARPVRRSNAAGNMVTSLPFSPQGDDTRTTNTALTLQIPSAPLPHCGLSAFSKYLSKVKAGQGVSTSPSSPLPSSPPNPAFPSRLLLGTRNQTPTTAHLPLSLWQVSKSVLRTIVVLF